MEFKTPPNARNSTTYENSQVVSAKGIHKNNFPYIFIWVVYYAWVVLFTTWWTASPIVTHGFSTELRSLLHTVNLISSGIFIFIIRKDCFVKTARIGAILVIAGIVLFLIAPNPQLQQLCIIIIGIALGLVNTSILMPFVFTLNNTEKLYAVVGSNLLISLISLFQDGRIMKRIDDLWFSAIMLAIALSTTLFFKKNCLPEDTNTSNIDTPNLQPRIYLTLLFNCVLAILCKGAGQGILNIAASASDYPVLQWHYLGSLVGCIAYLAIYAHSKKPFIWLGNITFSFFAMGLFCNSFMDQIPGLVVPFAILLGIGNGIGMINVYYILGVVGKKYNSMRYLRLSIIFIGICGGVSGIAVGNFIHNRKTFRVSMIASMVSVAVMLLFIMLTAVVSQSQYYDDWAKDSEKTDIDNEQLYLFKKYCLSKRELEVCKLLLQGYTLRQISGILSIAYSTVNTYCTSLYRKLEINSRTELLLLFKEYSLK